MWRSHNETQWSEPKIGAEECNPKNRDQFIRLASRLWVICLVS